ncbi:MAG: hypothetical protein GY723_03310 [bacterium]|nr:hypothetical protein [bacterium]MCP5069616.1 hypothetical protein [bacterium]
MQFRPISLLLAALLLIAAPGLAGGMVKYRTPDGKIGYASPGLVPEGATVESSDYRPDGRLSRRPRSERAVTPSKQRTSPPKPEAVKEARAQALSEERTRAEWAGKARIAKRELATAERNYETWQTRCGGKDPHHSLYELPPGCTTVEKGRLDAALQELEEKRYWVEDGLFDACRLSDECLPGYIR